MKKILAAAIATLLVLTLAIALSVSLYNSSTKVQIRETLREFAEDLSAREEIAPIVSLLEYGMIDVDGRIEVIGNDFLDYNLTFGGSLYIESDAREIMLKDGHYRYGKDSAHFDVYCSEDEAYLDSEELLWGRYGIVRGEMTEGLENSLLNPNTFSDSALSTENYDRLKRLLELYDDGYDVTLEEDIIDYGETYYDLFCDELMDTAEFTRQETDYGIGFLILRAELLEISVTAEDFANILTAVYDELCEDERLRDLVIDHIYKISFIMEAEVSDPARMYDDFLADFKDWIDEIHSIENAKDYRLALRIYKNLNSGKLMSVGLYSESHGESQTIIKLETDGQGAANSSEFKLVTGDRTISYNIFEKNENYYKSNLYVDGKLLLKTTIARADETFRFTGYGEDGNTVFTVRGDWDCDGDIKNIVLKTVKFEDSVHNMNVRITIDPNASMPRPEKIEKTVFECDIEQLKALFSELSTKSEPVEYFRFRGTYVSQNITLAFYLTGDVKMKVLRNDGTYAIYAGKYEAYSKKGIFFEFDENQPYQYFSRGANKLIELEYGISINGTFFGKEETKWS